MGEVTDYIGSVDEPARSMLERLRGRAQALVPDAAEGTSYGFDSTKGGIRFTDAQPIPTPVFDRLVRDRRDEIDATLAVR